MDCGILNGLVTGTESVVFDYEVIGSAVSSIDTGNILNGDEDCAYTIIARLNGTNAGSRINLKINSDSGTNYGRRGISASSTTVSDSTATAQAFIPVGYSEANQSSLFVGTMYAKSGSARLLNCSMTYSISGATVGTFVASSYVWNNSISNIVSFLFASNAANDIGVGSRVIILKGNNFTNGIPTGIITTPKIEKCWTRVGSQLLSAPASSVTFTGLDGDKAVCYYLSAVVKAKTGTINGLITYNGDGVTNYGFQRLTGSSTSVSGARATAVAGKNFVYSTVNGYSMGNALIFAKSGFVRPSISNEVETISGTTVTTLEIFGNSWNNTDSNITTIAVSTANEFDIGSQFDLYALYT